MPTTTPKIPVDTPQPTFRVRIPAANRRPEEIPARVLADLPDVGIPKGELIPVLNRDSCFKNILTKFRQAEDMNLPTAKEIDRAKVALELAYRKWYLLRTARDTQAIRKNEFLLQLQKRAQKIRKEEIMRRVRLVIFRVNKSSPHLEVHVPGVDV
jgi:hypothetical protein